MASRGSPRMLAATTSPWYLPTWVSSRTPVTSPMAHSRSPARRCASTGIPRSSGCMPTVSRPSPATRGRRPVATSRRSPRSSRPSSRLEDVVVRRRVARRSRARRAAARRRHGAGPRRAPRPAARARGRAVLGALDEGHLAAQAPHGLRHLDADRPAAEDEQPPRDGLHPGHLAVGPHALELAQARDRGHERSPSRSPRTTCSAVCAYAVDLDHARPGEPAGAAEQVDALAGQPRSCPASE